MNYNIVESNMEDANFIEERIVEFNASNVPFTAPIPFSKINKNIKNENGEIIAGINCVYYAWHCLLIDALWVNSDYRNNGLGTDLLNSIELSAKEFGIKLIHVDTFDFQAKDFYIKLGYEVFGVQNDCPPGHKRYYLQKTI
ncbi:GNAT family N-acetyltransferase [Paenibacillus xylanexedens]|uniref:GNAT family N-acetyltransferase n=1 Tax=Paenibacillus xylanexedens TaxID=528191 RepID=UPI0009384CBD|nr:GNAT family N-acetyltransferase [Paenibacillus xylanexedens]APO47190.1 GNAT family N-acetyltransferase [Paenibacillus xylanexedens]